MSFKKIAFLIILLSVIASVAPVWAAVSNDRFKFMGTSIISLPTAYTRSSMAYIHDNGDSSFFCSQCLFTNSIEISLRRYQTGPRKDLNAMNAKIKLIGEKLLFPTVAYGISDVYKELGDRIYYFAASKTIDAFGIKLHGGVYRDPLIKANIKYYGAEKIILPLISVCAERCGNVNAYGVKLSPYPGLNLEISRRDKNEEIYNVDYYLSY